MLLKIFVRMNIFKHAWFQASAAKSMSTALFWVVTQRVVVISYRRFGTTNNESFLSSEFKKFPCRVPTEYLLYRSENSCGIRTLPMHGRIARKQKETNMKIKRLYSMAGDRETLRSVRLSNAVKSGRKYWGTWCKHSPPRRWREHIL